MRDEDECTQAPRRTAVNRHSHLANDGRDPKVLDSRRWRSLWRLWEERVLGDVDEELRPLGEGRLRTASTGLGVSTRASEGVDNEL